MPDAQDDRGNIQHFVLQLSKRLKSESIDGELLTQIARWVDRPGIHAVFTTDDVLLVVERACRTESSVIQTPFMSASDDTPHPILKEIGGRLCSILLDRIQSNLLGIADRLFEYLSKTIRHSSLVRSLSDQDIDDLIQDGYIKFQESLTKRNYRFASHYATYCYRIVANLALDQLSRLKESRDMIIDKDLSEIIGLKSDTIGQEQSLIRREEETIARKALAMLDNTDCHEILKLRSSALSYQKIGDWMGIPKKSAERLYKKCMESLKAKVAALM